MASKLQPLQEAERRRFLGRLVPGRRFLSHAPDDGERWVERIALWPVFGRRSPTEWVVYLPGGSLERQLVSSWAEVYDIVGAGEYPPGQARLTIFEEAVEDVDLLRLVTQGRRAAEAARAAATDKVPAGDPTSVLD